MPVPGEMISAPVAEGFILMDLARGPLAFDRGASAIFQDPEQAGRKHDSALEEIFGSIRSFKRSELQSVTMRFRVGEDKYICRVFLLQPKQPAMSSEGLVALHLEKDCAAADAVSAVAAEYNLTEREVEALRGISKGLSSKELAVAMNISPNTVKVFVRMIAIKMGVATRGEMISKVLEYQSRSNSAKLRVS